MLGFSLLALCLLIVRFILERQLLPTLKPTKAKPSWNNLACAARTIEDVVPLYKKLTRFGLGCSLVGVILLLVNGFNGSQLHLATILFVAVALFAGELLSRSGFYSLGPRKPA